MTMKCMLKGITWDHPRGYESIEAVSREYTNIHPEVCFQWDKQSLKNFGDYPVEKLAEKYDLIMLDHPHIGNAVKANALLALDEWLDEDTIKEQSENSVGKSFISYQRDGHQWALPADAAAQVSAYRKDLMEARSLKLPKTWMELLKLASDLAGSGEGPRVGIPLCPTDIYCTLISLCANLSGDGFFTEQGIDHGTLVQALEFLGELAEYLHPRSLELNPIQMLEIMAETDEIAYVPYLFGYSNYARKDRKTKNCVYFTNIPGSRGEPDGALLGGVGIGVSSGCAFPEAVCDFARYAVSAEVQKGIYYENAGQPGHLAAWTNEKINEDSNGFFADTLETLKRAYLRPRYEGYNEFQEEAGALLNEAFREKMSAEETAGRIENLLNGGV